MLIKMLFYNIINWLLSFYKISSFVTRKRKNLYFFYTINLFCVFYGIILNLPVLHRMLTNAVRLVLSFISERMPFLPFLFYSPYAGFCKNCIRRHVKPESSSVQVCPKCFRCPRSIRIINPRKSVVKHLGA